MIWFVQVAGIWSGDSPCAPRYFFHQRVHITKSTSAIKSSLDGDRRTFEPGDLPSFLWYSWDRWYIVFLQFAGARNIAVRMNQFFTAMPHTIVNSVSELIWYFDRRPRVHSYNHEVGRVAQSDRAPAF